MARNSKEVLREEDVEKKVTKKPRKPRKSKKSRKSIDRQIVDIHKEMKKDIIESGIQEPQYNFLIKNLKKKNPEEKASLLSWLSAFREEAYKPIRNLLDEQPPHYWENLKRFFNTRDFPEVILLNKLKKELREEWKSRPRVPRKKKASKNVASNTDP